MDIQDNAIEKTVRQRLKEWRIELLEHKHLILLSLVLMAIAFVLDFLAGSYAQRKGAAVSPDLILDSFKPIDLGPIFTWGFIIVVGMIFFYPLLFKVKKIHVATSQFGLLVAIRSVFICLTHLKTPPDAIITTFPGILSVISFTNDLFFSGHVAIPFLGFLIFKGDRIRYFFLAMSIVMAATVLLMHLHYSIDVFSAYFIAFGSFKIGEVIFRKINRY